MININVDKYKFLAIVVLSVLLFSFMFFPSVRAEDTSDRSTGVEWISPREGSTFSVGETIPLEVAISAYDLSDQNTSTLDRVPSVDSSSANRSKCHGVDFYWVNSTRAEYIGHSMADTSGYATVLWNTTGLAPGMYYTKCNVTDEKEAGVNIHLVNEVIDVALRGRKWTGGGAYWTNVSFTGGMVLHPTLPGVYDIAMGIDVDGSTLETRGKLFDFLFISRNPSYITIGLWIGDRIIASGFGFTSLIDLFTGDGMAVWAASSIREEELFLKELSTAGLANKIEGFSVTYPPSGQGNIVELCTEFITFSTTSLDLDADIESASTSALDAGVDRDMVTDLAGPVIKGFAGIVQHAIADFAGLSEIAMEEHKLDVQNLADETAKRLPDVLGPVEGTGGLTYILKSIQDVSRSILQSAVDMVLTVIATIFRLISKILPLVIKVLG